MLDTRRLFPLDAFKLVLRNVVRINGLLLAYERVWNPCARPRRAGSLVPLFQASGSHLSQQSNHIMLCFHTNLSPLSLRLPFFFLFFSLMPSAAGFIVEAAYLIHIGA